MSVVVIEGAALLAGLVLAVVAQCRGWRPSVQLALVVGIGLRGAVLAAAALDTHQPVDLWDSFLQAGQDILNRQDPVLSADSGWHFLPMSAYAFALTLLTQLPWEVALRLYPMVADIVLIVLVGRLATQYGALRRFQYACSPIAAMVCALHGQLQSVALVFGVAAFLLARTRRGARAGLLMGFALSANSWPVLLIPGVLAALGTHRQRLRACVGLGAVPALFFVTLPLGAGTPVERLPEVFEVLGGIRPIVGDWGWTAVATGGHQALATHLGRPGSIVLFATLFVVGWLWRRADPLDLTIALLLAFLVVTPRLGAQYLLMPVPFLIARPTRGTQLAMAASALWAATGYLYLTRLTWIGWQEAHVWWSLSSWAVIPLLAFALPWTRRRLRHSTTLPTPRLPAPRQESAPAPSSMAGVT